MGLSKFLPYFGIVIIIFVMYAQFQQIKHQDYMIDELKRDQISYKKLLNDYDSYYNMLDDALKKFNNAQAVSHEEIAAFKRTIEDEMEKSQTWAKTHIPSAVKCQLDCMYADGTKGSCACSDNLQNSD